MSDFKTPPSSSAGTHEWQALIDAFPGIAMLLDRDGIVLAANRYGLERVGLTLGEAVGRDVGSMLDPDIYRTWQEQIAAAATRGEASAWESVWGDQNYRNSVALIRGTDHRVWRIATFSEDVTAMREAERRLRDSEERYRLLAENSRDVIWTLDLKTRRFTYVSPAVQRLRGFTPEEVMNSPVDEALTPESRLRVRNAINTMMQRIAEGQRSDLTTVTDVDQPHRDGHIVHTEVSTTYLLDEAGVPVSLLGVTRDVSKRRQAEAALRASEEQFRFLAENTADVVWQLDAQMCFVYINGADERLRGVPRDQVIGQHVSRLFTAEGNATIAALVRERQAREASGVVNETLRFEAQQVKADGSAFWVEINSTPIYAPDGSITGYSGMTRDIDRRKQQEADLAETRRLLEAQVKEITELQLRLQEQAVRDALSGLHNRRYLDETLPRELARAKREGYPLALIMIDLDHFKRINDTYGHPAGDRVITTLARILADSARESDILCRFGGEEFLAVLPGMGREAAQERAERWRQALAAEPVLHGQFPIAVTMSAGIAVYPASGAELQHLLHGADDALYQAKNQGRNRVVCS